MSRSQVTVEIYDGWSAWQRLPLDQPMTGRVLREILDGGQAFRWQHRPDGTWLGVFAENVARVALSAEAEVVWSAPAKLASRTEARIHEYFGKHQSIGSLVDRLPWRSDPHLSTCLQQFPGLRILQQPLTETLLCFLCSATKQIVQIKQMVAALAERFGTAIATATVAESARKVTFHRLPTWQQLASVNENELRSCALGFRARYIKATAVALAQQPELLARVQQLPYESAKEALCTLPGVGEKVADCVLLFGAGRFEAFPVDVWILRTMQERYGLRGWSVSQLAQFGRVHFGPLAGLAQQYLFAFERDAAK